MKFAIYEENLERLTKKLNTIKNKCQSHGYPFMYEEIGEEFRDYKICPEDPQSETIKLRYVIIDVEGVVKHNDWEFVAVIAHESAGNVVRAMKTNVQVPDKYFTTEPICEHCNTKRRRKDTYLIYNEVTDEFKQVGKTCLQEFTNGMDAELVAAYIACFDQLIEGEAPSGSSNFERYQSTKEVLMYALETVKHFGYQSSSDYEWGNCNRTTRTRCMDYYAVATGATRWMSAKEIQKNKEEMDAVQFDAKKNEKLAEEAIAWALDQDTSGNSYINNLHVICSSDYVAGRNLGILISLASVYLKHLGKLEEKKRRESAHASEAAASSYQGQVGDRLELDIASYECTWSGENMYGLSFLYKFIDVDGNVYMWSTSNPVKDDYKISIKGTVKKHEEFNGVEQTWLTRCKVTYISEIEDNEEHSEGTFDVNKVLDRVFGE